MTLIQVTQHKILWIASYTLAFSILFYIIKILSLLNIQYYPSINRITYIYIFNESIINNNIDNIILIILPIIFVGLIVKDLKIRIALLVLCIIFIINIMDFIIYLLLPLSSSIFILKRFREVMDVHILLQSIFSILLALESYILLKWFTYSVDAYTLTDPAWFLPNMDMKIFYVFGRLSPFLILTITFSYLLKPYIKSIHISLHQNIKLPFDMYKMILYLAVSLSIILPIYPYLPSTNPDMRGISVDEQFYVEWIDSLESNDVYQLIHNTFTKPYYEERSLTILLIYALEHIFPNSIRFLPLLLTPTFLIITYYIIKQLFNEKLASIAALLTVSSYIFIVGVYAGLYANWIAMIAFHAAILALVNLAKNYTIRNLVMATSITLLMLFLHSYTWGYMIITLMLFLVLSIFYNNKAVIPMLLIIMINVGVIMVKVYYIESSGIDRVIQLSDLLFGIEKFELRWFNLEYTFTYFMGGYFTNTVLLLLTLIYALKSDLRSDFNRLLLSSIFVASIPIIFGDFVVQSRILYNIPIHIPAAFTLYHLFNTNNKSCFMLAVVIILHLIIYSVRSLVNMYPIIT